MSNHELKQCLMGCILDVLRDRAYSPPRTPDPEEKKRYVDGIVGAILARIASAGWAILPPGARWRGDSGPSDMTPAEAAEDLRLCVRFALTAYPARPPRTHDFCVTERYHAAVAKAVVGKILQSNWDLQGGLKLQKQPPARPHSTPRH